MTTPRTPRATTTAPPAPTGGREQRQCSASAVGPDTTAAGEAVLGRFPATDPRSEFAALYVAAAHPGARVRTTAEAITIVHPRTPKAHAC